MSTDPYVLQVAGEGSISVTPNRVLITLGATTEAPNQRAAQTANSEIINKVIQSLLQLGIPQADIKTIDYRIEPQYNFADGKQTLRGYQVTHLLQVTLNNIARTSLVVDTAVSSGANTVSSVQFTVSKPEAYYNHALASALKNAEQKAIAMASTLSLPLLPVPRRVQETSVPPMPVPSPIALYSKAAATPIQPGQLEISATVQVEYSYAR